MRWVQVAERSVVGRAGAVPMLGRLGQDPSPLAPTPSDLSQHPHQSLVEAASFPWERRDQPAPSGCRGAAVRLPDARGEIVDEGRWANEGFSRHPCTQA